MTTTATATATAVRPPPISTPAATPLPSPRTTYHLSPLLLRAANTLPSNPGRSLLVHSLVHAFGLLDVSDVDCERRAELLAALEGCEATEGEKDEEEEEKARAKLIIPEPADERRLAAFHSPTYVRFLLRPVHSHGNGGTAPRNASGAEGSHGASAGRAGIPSSLGGRPFPYSSSDSDSESSSEGDGGEDARAGGRAPRRKRRKTERYGLEDDCPPFPLLSTYVTHLAGAAISAARELVEDRADVAIVWDGGRHHAKKSQASGFCYINDVVLAILELKKPRPKSKTVGETRGGKGSVGCAERIERVMYVDLDLHHGDGVEEAFYHTPSVLTLSVHFHAPGFFPSPLAPFVPPAASTNVAAADENSRGQPSRRGPPGSLHAPSGPPIPSPASFHALSLPLLHGASSNTLLNAIRSSVLPILRAYDPHALVVQCGADGLAGDPCAEWNLGSDGLVAAVQALVDEARRRPTPGPGPGSGRGAKVLLLGGGGYVAPNAARVWAAITARVLGRDLGRSSPDHGGDVNDRRPDGSGSGSGSSASGRAPTPAPDGGDLDALAVGEDEEVEIPDHAFWDKYAPGDTLAVAEGMMRDLNDAAYLDEVRRVFEGHTEKIRSRKGR